MSAKGTSTFIIQRATAVLLTPVAIWLLLSFIGAFTAGEEEARRWLEQPLNAVLLASFMIVGAWHMRIGMAEIIIDYIHSWMKDILLLINWLIALALIVASAGSLYNISFAG